MKNLYTKRKSLTAVVLTCVMAVSVLFYACKKPTEGIKVLVSSSSLFPAPTLLQFKNADTISNLLPANLAFTVTVSGPDAALVQLSSGGTDFKASSGLLSLALTKGTIPTIAKPVVFTVTATIPGFAPVTQNISLTKNALTVIPVRAVEYAHLPVGTTGIIGATTALTAGTLVNQYNINTNKTATMNEQAYISFTAGTQMQDANGTAINGVTLTSNIVQYGTGTDASLQAFPGGLTAPVALKNDKTPIAGGVNFVTAGALQLNLDVNGTPVKKFSKPVTVTVELNNNLTNFASTTAAAMAVGDKIPVWSMDETTGIWTNEADATVVLDANNRKAAQFSMTHLCVWNLDWTWGAFGAYGTCGSQLTVNINPSNLDFVGGPYEITLQTPTGQYLGGLHGVTISKNFSATFPSLPNIPQAKIVVSGGIPYARIQSAIFAPCSAGSVSLTMPVGSVNPISVNVDIRGICSGKDITVLPSATFVLYQQTGGSQAQGNATFSDAGTIQLTNGIGTTSLQVGAQYYFITVYNGTTYKTDVFSVSKADIPIPSTTTALQASATYDAATNSLNIKGTIPINCN